MPMVTHIEIRPLLRQQLYHFRLTPEGCVVGGEISSRVLMNREYVYTQSFITNRNNLLLY